MHHCELSGSEPVLLQLLDVDSTAEADLAQIELCCPLLSCKLAESPQSADSPRQAQHHAILSAYLHAAKVMIVSLAQCWRRQKLCLHGFVLIE